MRINITYQKGRRTKRSHAPPSQRSPSSQPPSPDYSATSSEDEDGVGNWAGQQPQPCLWTLPPKPQTPVVHTFIGPPNRKSSEAAHITRESTPLCILMLFFAEFITLLVVNTNRNYHQFLDNFEDGPSPNVRWQKQKCLRFWLWHYRWDIHFKTDWRITGWKWNSFALHSMDKGWHILGIVT